MTSLLEHTIILPENRFLLQSPFLSFSVTVLEKVDQINRMELKKKLRLWNGFEYCPGFSWDRVNFLLSSWYSAVFWI